MGKRDVGTRLLKRAERARVELDPNVAVRLAAYVSLLRRWSTRMNLTALDDSDAGLDRLIVEPLAAARRLPRRGWLIDIGSGGGSPAIPLQIARPELTVRMVEGKTRKGAFLREAARQLELKRLTVEGCRFEELLTRPELHEAHHVLTVRAVRIEAGMLRNLQAFVAPGGVLALFRGTGATDAPLDLQPPLVWEATYPLVESLQSHLLIIRKLSVKQNEYNTNTMTSG